jgi:serine/threonine-protein kinase RsbW
MAAVVRADEITEPIVCFPGRAASVKSARSYIRERLGADWPGLDDVLLVFSEIAANAVRHTASGNDGTFRVAMRVNGPTVRVEVGDDGGSSSPEIPDSPNAEALTGGRGLRIVGMLSDSWGHSGDELGRVVWFEVTSKPDQ